MKAVLYLLNGLAALGVAFLGYGALQNKANLNNIQVNKGFQRRSSSKPENANTSKDGAKKILVEPFIRGLVKQQISFSSQDSTNGFTTFILRGTVVGPEKNMRFAFIEDPMAKIQRTYKEGDFVEGAKIIQILPKGIIVKKGKIQKRISIRFLIPQEATSEGTTIPGANKAPSRLQKPWIKRLEKWAQKNPQKIRIFAKRMQRNNPRKFQKRMEILKKQNPALFQKLKDLLQ
ncbi:MAG: hypothetical protein D6785_09680 [Planctomycetota bacterium]|nr:MAG: hypothetical protein D6785_09680 [Planctomycetota bacterium]